MSESKTSTFHDFLAGIAAFPFVVGIGILSFIGACHVNEWEGLCRIIFIIVLWGLGWVTTTAAVLIVVEGWLTLRAFSNGSLTFTDVGETKIIYKDKPVHSSPPQLPPPPPERPTPPPTLEELIVARRNAEVEAVRKEAKQKNIEPELLHEEEGAIRNRYAAILEDLNLFPIEGS